MTATGRKTDEHLSICYQHVLEGGHAQPVVESHSPGYLLI